MAVVLTEIRKIVIRTRKVHNLLFFISILTKFIENVV